MSLLGDDSETIYEHSGNLSFSSKIIIIHCCLFLLSTHPAGHEASSFGIISARRLNNNLQNIFVIAYLPSNYNIYKVPGSE